MSEGEEPIVRSVLTIMPSGGLTLVLHADDLVIPFDLLKLDDLEEYALDEADAADVLPTTIAGAKIGIAQLERLTADLREQLRVMEEKEAAR